MRNAIGYAVGLVIVWVLCEWRLRDRRQISSVEFIDRLKRLERKERAERLKRLRLGLQ